MYLGVEHSRALRTLALFSIKSVRPISTGSMRLSIEAAPATVALITGERISDLVRVVVARGNRTGSAYTVNTRPTRSLVPPN